MKSKLKALWSKVRPKTQKELDEEWLGQSKDLCELERRIKSLHNPCKFNYGDVTIYSSFMERVKRNRTWI